MDHYYSPIIKSLLDNDFYKFTMHNAVIQLFPDLKVRYYFIDRDKRIYPKGFGKIVKQQIEYLKSIVLKDAEYKYLLNINDNFSKMNYADILSDFRFDPNTVDVFIDESGQLNISIEGYWKDVILWEVPILSIISELYYKYTNSTVDINSNEIHKSDIRKCKKFLDNVIMLSEFGTRRRYSFSNQERVIKLLSQNCKEILLGTSNVHFAKKYDLKPIGTVAHEWFMVHGGLFGYQNANKTALDNWYKVYEGSLGIALSDTYTSDLFLTTSGKENLERFTGIRHDSGDPFLFVDKVLKAYEDMGIDLKNKFIIFSDGLDTDMAINIQKYCDGRIKALFGIGTDLTNDVGVNPLNIVIKINQIRSENAWKNVVKLTDVESKATGKKNELDLCRQAVAESLRLLS
jgi:nicotinate phosphoribosyltransferase